MIAITTHLILVLMILTAICFERDASGKWTFDSKLAAFTFSVFAGGTLLLAGIQGVA